MFEQDGETDMDVFKLIYQYLLRSHALLTTRHQQGRYLPR